MEERFDHPLHRVSGDGEAVTIKGLLRRGFFSDIYAIEIEGSPCVLKVGANHRDGPLPADARKVIYNEIQVYGHLEAAGNPHPLYVKAIEIDDLIGCVLRHREDMVTIAEYIGVQDGERKGKKEEVRAERAERIPPQTAIEIVKSIAQQVRRYHESPHEYRMGVIHMDINPHNILVKPETGEAIPIDFGLAAENGGDINRLFNKVGLQGVRGPYYSDVGIGVVRNRTYSPPDLDSYKTADPAIDRYGITNVLCLMLTGRLREGWDGDAMVRTADREKIDLRELEGILFS